MTGAGTRALRIALVACVTRADDLRTGAPPLVHRIRGSLRRFLNDLHWKGRGEFRFHYWQYEGPGDRNAGDSAIREATRHQLTRLFAPRPVEFLEIPWRAADAAAAARVNETCDLAVWSAGAVAHLDAAGRLPARFGQYVDFLQALRIPAAAYGIGVSTKLAGGEPGPAALHPEARSMLAAFAGSLALCGVRDKASGDFLRAVAGEGAPIADIADPALFLQAGPQAGMAVRGVPVGVSFAFHGPYCEGLASRFVHTYIETLRRIQESIPGASFHYFMHCPSESLLVRLFEHAGIGLEVVSGPPGRLLAAYSLMRIHVGQMLHSCVLAANAGVPPLGLAYDSKHLHFFSSLGLSQYCLPPSEWDPARIAAKAVELHERRDEISSQIRNSISVLRGRQEAFLKDLARLAGEGRSQA